MNKLLVHLGLLMTCLVLLSGCTSGGSLPKEEKLDEPFDPSLDGLPVYVEVDQPYLKPSDADSSVLALYSYTPQASLNAEPTVAEVFSSDSDMVVTLNTQADNMGQSEYTLLEKSDSVYLVNHENNQLRLLSHFSNEVCDIIPSERVEETSDDVTDERVLTVLHDELVYVMTTEPKLGSTGDDCSSDAKKRYYALPLDHQLDPSLNEDGELKSLVLVKESVARSKLIFGWVPDPVNIGQDRLEYAYLGFDSENQELSLFGKNKQIVWSQPRELQAFDVIELAPNRFSSKYLFHVRALSHQQYLIQLGLDVFVVDSGLDLMTKAFSETDTILTDKVLTVSPVVDALENETSVAYALPVVVESDDDDLFVFDTPKIYHVAYQENVPVRNPSNNARIINQNGFMIDDKRHLSQRMFSQFDLKACAPEDAACFAAHDVQAQTWQFFTPCEEQFGCEVTTNTADNCETAAEKLQTQSDAPLCSASDYRHIAELNEVENDAELKAFLQYADDYVRFTHFILNNDQLLVNAKMNQKDIFLSYKFNVGFDAPKSAREQVLFGKRASLMGMDAYVVNNNLFLTALQKGALRSNECYKKDQKVLCNLSEVNDEGAINVCTGKDLSLGKCFNSFSEYESKALFCSAAQINDLSCSDANLTQINNLAIESEEEDAKWVLLEDYENSSSAMHLLAGNHTLALETQNLDEGKLYMPSLYRVDQTTGQKDTFIGALGGGVEKVVGGWLSKTATLGEAEVYGQLYLISDEVVQNGGMSNQREGRLTTYLLEQTYDELDVPDTFKTPKVAERLFERTQVIDDVSDEEDL